MEVVGSVVLAALGWVASPLVEKLLNEGFAGLGTDAEKKLQKLRVTILPVLKSVIEKAEGSEHRSEVEDWLQRLKEAYDDAEDALDLLNYHHLRRKVAAARRTNRVRSHFRIPKHLKWIMHALKGGRDMLSPKKIKLRRRLNKLEKIASEAEKLRDLLGIQPYMTVAVPDISLPPQKVFGRDEDRDEIIRRLKMKSAAAIGDPGSTRIPVIAIVGRPGVGKTTLAQYVCEQLRSESDNSKHFDLVMWVHACHHFSASEIMKDIIEQASIISGRQDHGNLGIIDSLEVLRLKMNRKLRVKKFLLVIDNVWCDREDHRKNWDTLFRCLSKCVRGSKILVTSQTDDAPRKIGATRENIYRLKELEENDFLDLVIHHALPSGEVDSCLREELVEKCRTIAKKLNKDPTAAEMVGKTIATKVADLLQSQDDLNAYLSTIAQKDWSGDKTQALMWSYQHLPAHLQRCFSYCSLYPRRYKFKALELIKLWMAQGFIKPDDQNERMEDVGNGYLNDLVSRFYIQHHNCTYTLHELLYDLAEKVSRNDCVRIEGNRQSQIPSTIRHLCIPANKLNENKEEICELKKLRTLIVTGGESVTSEENVATDIFNGLKKLRVLVSEINLENLAEFISEMKHLRVLRVSDTREFVLPESVCTLYQLQVLEVENASSLPKCLDNLVSLRYLQPSSIADIRKLTSLQGLENFQVRQEEGYELEQRQDLNDVRASSYIGRIHGQGYGAAIASASPDCLPMAKNVVLEQLQNLNELRGRLRIANLEDVESKEKIEYELKQLQSLNELRGRLRIANLENVKSKESAIAANLKEKKYLDILQLVWSAGEDNVNSNLDVEILEGLQLPPNLTSLSLDGYRGRSCPSWPEYQTGNIQELALRRCKMLTELPLMDQIFPSCRSLELSHISKLKALHALPPQLTTLIIENTQALISLVGIGSLPHLKELYLSRCPCLDSKTAFLSSSLEIITFESCADVDVILDNADLPCLSDLTITGCHMRTASLQFGNLPSLRSLDISHCPGSFSADLQELHSLGILILHNCSNLEAVTNLPGSLTSLEIHGCPILEKRSINIDPLSGVRMLGNIPIEDSFEHDL